MTIQTAPPRPDLTYGQREVLILMAAGLSNSAIAERLSISPRTVEGRIDGLYDRLGVPRESESNPRVLAVLLFLDGGLR